MITIPLELPNELARRVMPFQDRLTEIIELGLRQIEMSEKSDSSYSQTKQAGAGGFGFDRSRLTADA